MSQGPVQWPSESRLSTSASDLDSILEFIGVDEVLDTSMLNSRGVSISLPDVPSTWTSFRPLEFTQLRSSMHLDVPEPPRICSTDNDGGMSLVPDCHSSSIEMSRDTGIVPAEGQVILLSHFRPLLPSSNRTRLVKSSTSVVEIRKR